MRKLILDRRSRIVLLISAVTLSALLAGYVASVALLPNHSGKENATVINSQEVLSKRGSRGSEVRQIQTKLKNWGYYTGNIDGIYGKLTEEAVRKFQRYNNLTVDGIAGSNTLRAMGISSSSANTSSNANIELLARAVYGEARGEPYVGQVAVAAVILNRVDDSRFPKTISGVVYQSGAFDVVADGQINLTPNATAYQAARDALNGWDPTYGCLYYYNPKTATNAWIKQLPIALTIGSHVFCKAN